MKKACVKAIVYGFLSGTAFLLLFGILSAIIPTPFFKRMDPALFLDYFFLVATAALVGVFVALHIIHKSKKCTLPAASGALGGFVGFSCALCNKLLIFLLGVGGVVALIRPYQPVLGFIGVGLLLLAVVRKIKAIRLFSSAVTETKWDA